MNQHPAYFILKARLIHFDPETGPTFGYSVVATSDGDGQHAIAVLDTLKAKDPTGIYLLTRNVKLD